MKKDYFKDKVVLITGSSQGIGKSLAFQLAGRGAKVALNGRNPTKLEKAWSEANEKNFEVFQVQGDVSNYENCQRIVAQVVSHFGQLDILVNNAGMSTSLARVENFHPEAPRKVMEINYLSAFYMTQHALPHLKKTKGSVLFVSSLVGLQGMPDAAPYSASKMALTALAESLRIELVQSGVSVGIAYVGFVENEPGKVVLSSKGGLEPKTIPGGFKLAPIEQVAQKIIWMLEQRRFRSVFSFVGKLMIFLKSLFPGLFFQISKRVYLRRQKSK
jgi:NAD(P)-dependent dehydrogenase (short-subunit alcohol dehydrogenase family)